MHKIIHHLEEINEIEYNIIFIIHCFNSIYHKKVSSVDKKNYNKLY